MEPFNYSDFLSWSEDKLERDGVDFQDIRKFWAENPKLPSRYQKLHYEERVKNAERKKAEEEARKKAEEEARKKADAAAAESEANRDATTRRSAETAHNYSMLNRVVPEVKDFRPGWGATGWGRETGSGGGGKKMRKSKKRRRKGSKRKSSKRKSRKSRKTRRR
jgi:hypothetical protein